MRKVAVRTASTTASGPSASARQQARQPLRSGDGRPGSSAGRLGASLIDKVSYAETKGTLFDTVDEESMLQQSTFPIKPADLIQLTKEFLAANNGCDKPELLADDFTFAGPVVGPLPRDTFVKAFTGFKVNEAFPDMKANPYNFHVDPFEHNRVWVRSHPFTLSTPLTLLMPVC